MNNQAPLTIAQPPDNQTPPSRIVKNKPYFYKKLMAILVILLLVAFGTAGYFAFQYFQLKNRNVSEKCDLGSTETPFLPEPSVKPTNAFFVSPTPSSQGSIEWKRTDVGNFSFEYPLEWFVGDLWNLGQDQRTRVIAIDRKPISTAPRGGPIATFEISVKNGLDNPNEVYETDQKNFKESVTGLEEEVIESKLGKIYHYKGKLTGEYMRGQTVEKYFLMFEINVNDPINQQVMEGSLHSDDLSLSAMFRRIILSIDKMHY